MSKKTFVANKQKQESVGPFTVVIDVYGPQLDAMGHETSHVNPANHVRMTLHDHKTAREGGSVQGALSKMRTFSYDSKGKKVFDPLPFYKIVSVVDHGKIAQDVALIKLVDDIEDALEKNLLDDDFGDLPEYEGDGSDLVPLSELLDGVVADFVSQTEGAL